MLSPAARLIEHEHSFRQGACYHSFMEKPCGPSEACMYDCLGAIFAGYRKCDPEIRHKAAKRAFDLCDARYHHKRLGRLSWDEAFELLRDAEA